MCADWREYAACKDNELFFSSYEIEHEEPVDEWEDRLEQCKEICRTCPVRDACLEFAMQNSIYYGVWGGKSEWERLQHAKTGYPCPTPDHETVKHLVCRKGHLKTPATTYKYSGKGLPYTTCVVCLKINLGLRKDLSYGDAQAQVVEEGYDVTVYSFPSPDPLEYPEEGCTYA